MRLESVKINYMKRYKIRITEEQIGKTISPLDSLNKGGIIEK